MNLQRKLFSFEEILFYVSFSIFFIFSMISFTFLYQYIPKSIYKGFLILSILIALFREMYINKYSLKSLLGALFGALLMVNVMKTTSGLNLVALQIILIYFFRNVSFSKIAKLSLFLSGFILFTVIFLSKLGIITNYLEISWNGRIRNYLGFRYSLYAPAIFLNIIALFLGIKKEKTYYFEWIILFAINYWIYKQTDSRLSFFSGLLMILLGLILKIKPDILEKFKRILLLLIPIVMILPIFSYYIAVNFSTSNTILLKINKVFGNRLWLTQKSLNTYGYSLFGQRIHWQGNGLDETGNYITTNYLYVDNLYMQILQRYGLMFLLVLMVIIVFVLYKLYQKNQFILYVIVISTLLHSLIDDLVIYTCFNSFWFLVGSIINPQYSFGSSKTLFFNGKHRKLKFVFKKPDTIKYY